MSRHFADGRIVGNHVRRAPTQRLIADALLVDTAILALSTSMLQRDVIERFHVSPSTARGGIAQARRRAKG